MQRSLVTLLDRTANHIENTILFLGMSTALFVSLLNVIMRYIFSYPLTWPPELARYSHILIVFFGASAAIKSGTHLKVDVLYNLWPKITVFTNYFRPLIMIFYCVLVIILSRKLIIMQYITQQKSIALNIPYFILYAIPGIACCFMILRSIIEIIKLYKTNTQT